MKPVEIWSAADEPQLKQRLEQRAQPVLLKGLVKEWPAVQAGRASVLGICDYLHRFDRGNEVIATKTRAAARGVMGYNEGLSDFAFVKARMGLGEFMSHLQTYLTVEGAPSIAAQCAKVSEIIPGFLDENLLQALPGVIPNFWLGNALTVPVHHDHPYNLACVVAGRRRFTLFAPEQVGNLYIGPLEHTPSGAPISVVHPKDPDFERYPRYREALANAQVAEMEPGDALYLPPLWFHQVEALEKVNLLVNYWWPVVGDAKLPTPVASLLQAIQVLNALPADQREAWAAMFEHYVVQRDEDPSAHIPAAWHGVLARRR
ncbi:cupin-like domain-containing protein [Pelomonas sp. SE-A7]|uniref:cupin-like domain-containing protein n=1 Tax=Pelomonas sp. SE-A7 TaxID=3054953 RepID=UPI00259C8E8E|nr:cupin-like domain-containing protein [Pelomonas sp. SE-A7]MDM4766823.1 cupin-like domain-containing protein [Pelomonas sp. SE-A7]